MILKKRIDETSKYIRTTEKTTDYAYMFIPADGLYQDLLNSRVGSLKINSKDLVSYAYTKSDDCIPNESISNATNYSESTA